MAQLECTGTSNSVVSMQSAMTWYSYMWCTREAIQKYLDRESTIRIGTTDGSNYSHQDAKAMENDVVREVVAYLDSVYVMTISDSSALLIAHIAKLTAAQIGMARLGASMGNDLTPWTERYKNEAWAALSRYVINHNLSHVTKRTVPFWQRLMYAKSRERSIIPNV